MKKLCVGPCPCCGVKIYETKMPSIIQWDENGGRFNWRPRPVKLAPNGATFWILQTDSSRMQVSICEKCLHKLTDETAKKIFADIIFTKLDGIKGHSEKEYKLFDRIRTIEVWKWFYTEEVLALYLADYAKTNNNPGS